ncbi:TPA: LysR family transcriptional regulator [Kluyvera ascorbata]|uniref:LysR family transcriptional regulator n=1 Tax=Kluyvera genomosp. 2 TaxID=2774054 RepID=A0A2T2Y0R0_9ENTR|nr:MULTISPECIES: LysR family transcriptional regulator [Enterobacteriaceae]HAT3919304.1 LysR family transcriptional regulator [Kluyvera ascorbata]PSR46068.1 LysR family transcriptional regulator [Kluyvera genomosp. 2]BBQ85132.1 LysR family transcriptional regulator [Klebsiella sp. WP3-W18-ESBL-02]BBR22184.1 LysR family transcriptional regulator [Klebsiella sp. WP3-S18-ESBL-05]HAT3921463.1 LysR family transcriptional regulator [Kluyvera ascorbata]
MDKRQLSAFIAVFEERNITRAAEQLSLTQPALSATVKALEEELGTQLFVRKPRGVDVTEDARALYPHACRMLQDMATLTARFRKRQDRTPLTIGIEQDIASPCLASLLQRIRHEMPDTEVTLDPGCTGDIRLGCESLRCEDELFMPLVDERYVLAFPSDHDFSKVEELTTDQLISQPWITYPAHDSHQRFLPFYGTSAGAPNANAGSFTLALDLVEAGFGLAIAPQSLVDSRCNLSWRTLPGYPLLRRIGICYAVQAVENPAVSRLMDSLHERAATA